MVREMVGGCCVCSDDQGFSDNPLVYCDGDNCTVAVHQACYGILRVPSGSWYCRKCESQERAARVRCELCPSKDGALKRTDNGSWCHIVCALYIPEVRFEDTNTMEPIITSYIPSERFHKLCYLCEEIGRESHALFGAKMQCNNRPNCKNYFHVTCGQRAGLLCEEAGNHDHVKYTGYCASHLSKNKKEGIKQIPPYRPAINTDDSTPESSPRKIFSPDFDTISTLPQELGSSRSDLSSSHLEGTSSSSLRMAHSLAATKDYSSSSVSEQQLPPDEKKEKKKKRSPPISPLESANSSTQMTKETVAENGRRNSESKKQVDISNKRSPKQNGSISESSKTSKKGKQEPPVAKRKRKSRSQESTEGTKEEDESNKERVKSPKTRSSAEAKTEKSPIPPAKSNGDLQLEAPTNGPTTNGHSLTLEQLLERQWNQGSQFIMDQAAHFDIASLLSCLQHFRTENQRLEDRIRTLTMKRDQLLATNARLNLPGTSLYPMNGVNGINGVVSMNGSANGIPSALIPNMSLPNNSTSSMSSLGSTSSISSPIGRNPLIVGGFGAYSVAPSMSAINLSAAMSSPSSESISLASLRTAMSAAGIRPNSRSRSESHQNNTMNSGRSTPSSAGSNSASLAASQAAAAAAFFGNAISLTGIPPGTHLPFPPFPGPAQALGPVSLSGPSTLSATNASTSASHQTSKR